MALFDDNNGRGHEERLVSGRPRGGGRPAPRRAEAPAEAEQRTRIQQALAPPEDKYLPSPAPPKKAKKPKGKVKVSTVVKVMIFNMLKAGFVMLCIGAMIGSIAAVQVVQFAMDETSNDENILDLENYQMNQTSYFMAYNPDNPNAREENDYIEYQELVGDEDRIWVSYEDIPENLINAVVATEDREFWTHPGVNFRRTIGALVNEVIPVESWKGGASTITQQLVKNITKDADVVVDGDRTAGYRRKIREIFRAWGLTNAYSREMIMESYLNTIGLSERIAGVGAGAKRYFNKEVQDLTLTECAVIAGITQAPTRYSPIQNPDNALVRRNDVLYFMYQCEYITKAEYDEAIKKPLGLNRGTTKRSSPSGVFSYASDKAYNDVMEDLMEQYGLSRGAAMQYLYNGGLRVYLTVDLNVQQAVDDIMVTGYEPDGFFLDGQRFPGYQQTMTISQPVYNNSGQIVDYQDVMPQAAVIVINYKGELIATSGGIGEKTTSLSLNRSIGTVVPDENATGGYRQVGTVRQVGSTMKPIAAYALGIDYGLITYGKMVMDAAVMSKSPTNPKRDPETGAIVKDWPTNYGNNPGRKVKIPIVSAIAESTNTVAAQVGMWVGMENMFRFLTESLEVSSLIDPVDIAPAPLVLGAHTYGMSLYELAGSYMMFGGEDGYGVHNTLHSYTRVEDAKGNIVLQPKIMPQQAINPESAYVMNRLLNNVLNTQAMPNGASPTAGGMRPDNDLGIEAVAKTGTTSDDKDRLFVGLTPDYVTAVWWGYDVTRTPDGTDYDLHRWGPGARTNIPVNVWKALMESIQDERSKKTFPEMPEGVIVARFCTSSGNLARAGCPGSIDGYYCTFNGMPEECSGHEDELPPEGEEPPAE